MNIWCYEDKLTLFPHNPSVSAGQYAIHVYCGWFTGSMGRVVC